MKLEDLKDYFSDIYFIEPHDDDAFLSAGMMMRESYGKTNKFLVTVGHGADSHGSSHRLSEKYNLNTLCLAPYRDISTPVWRDRRPDSVFLNYADCIKTYLPMVDKGTEGNLRTLCKIIPRTSLAVIPLGLKHPYHIGVSYILRNELEPRGIPYMMYAEIPYKGRKRFNNIFWGSHSNLRKDLELKPNKEKWEVLKSIYPRGISGLFYDWDFVKETSEEFFVDSSLYQGGSLCMLG